eukprot:m.495427 g.495427  ORF g.495427 m.495427 type:complete len:345 (-) comp57300_c2_seq7:207-1241(-)
MADLLLVGGLEVEEAGGFLSTLSAAGATVSLAESLPQNLELKKDVHSISVCPLRREALVLTGSRAEVFSLDTLRPVKALQATGLASITASLIAKRGNRAFLGDQAGKIAEFDCATWAILKTFQAHKQRVCSIQESLSGQQLITYAGSDGARVWDLETLEQLSSNNRQGDISACVVLPHSTSHVVTGNMTGALEAWDYLTGALVRKIKPADAIGEEEDQDEDQGADGWMITELCASEIEPYFASGDLSGGVRMWNAVTFELCWRTEARFSGSGDVDDSDSIHAMAFLPSSGNLLVWQGFDDSTGHVYAGKSGEKLSEYIHPTMVMACVVLPNTERHQNVKAAVVA